MPKVTPAAAPAAKTHAEILADAKAQVEAAKKAIADAKAAEKAAAQAAKNAATQEQIDALDAASSSAKLAVADWADLEGSGVNLLSAPGADGHEDRDAYLAATLAARDALSALAKTLGAKRSRGNGTPRPRRTSGEITQMQYRMLAYLLDHADATRQELTVAGTNGNVTIAKHGISGGVLGQNDEAVRDPLSLWGRKLVKGTEVGGGDSAVRKEWRYALTAAGRKVAEKWLSEQSAS